MLNAASKEFGLLLAHFFGDERTALSAPAAAGLTGLGVREALNAMKLLESEGILSSNSRGRLFRARAGSKSYWRCRVAYLVRQRILG